MNSVTPANFVLCFVVIVFWATAALLSRVNRRRASPSLLIVPAFFLLLGLSINLYYPPYGTYAVAAIHVMMLPALLKVAKSRP